MFELALNSIQMTTHWHDSGMFMGMHWVWWILWILTILVLLWGIGRLLADRSNTHHRVGWQEEAEGKLRQRFAAGEIDEEEFARRMRILRDSSGTYRG